MKRFFNSYFFVFSILLFGSTSTPILSTSVVEIAYQATAQDYIQKFGIWSNALYHAARHGNHKIIVDLLSPEIAGDNKLDLPMILLGLRLEGRLYDLEALFKAVQDTQLTLQELIQVLNVFESFPADEDKYGDLIAPQRICEGSDALKFDQLSEELAKKIEIILMVTESNS